VFADLHHRVRSGENHAPWRPAGVRDRADIPAIPVPAGRVLCRSRR